MMTVKDALGYCLRKPAAYADTPFGEEPVCARIGGRIFAEAYISRGFVTLKCDADWGLIWRSQFPSHVRRGYHCPPVQQPYNNSVTLDGAIPDALLMQMMDHSYDHALASLPKRTRKEIELIVLSKTTRPE